MKTLARMRFDVMIGETAHVVSRIELTIAF